MPLSNPVAPPSLTLDKLQIEASVSDNPIEERDGLLGSIPNPVGGVRRERVSR